MGDCCGSWDSLGEQFPSWKPWSIFAIKSKSHEENVKTRKSIENVAVALEWVVFMKQCCSGFHSGGVPLPFVDYSILILAFTHKTNCFFMFFDDFRRPGAEALGGVSTEFVYFGGHTLAR